jgi:ABC-type maltose transport system permease subunit
MASHRPPEPQPFESALLSRSRIALSITVTVTVVLDLPGAYATDRLRITGQLRCA